MPSPYEELQAAGNAASSVSQPSPSGAGMSPFQQLQQEKVSPIGSPEQAQFYGLQAGRTPEEQTQYMRGRGHSDAELKRLDQEYRLEQARRQERQNVPAPLSEDASIGNIAKTGAAVAERMARKAVSFSDVLPTTLVGKNTREAQKAAEALQKGEATPEQIKLVAQEERLSQQDAEQGKTLGGKILGVMESAPKILGEMVVGGKALQMGGKTLGFGKAAAPVSLAGTFSPTAARAALAEPTLARVVGTHAGRMAAITPLVPSMYFEDMQQRNVAEGKAANDLSNAPVTLAHAYANMLVLGSMQKNFGIGGNAVSRSLVKGGIFTAEQGTADALFNLADRQVSGANQFNTKYGTFEHLLSGNVGEAAREATVQAFTGAMFAGLHEIGTPTTPAQEKQFQSIVKTKLQDFTEQVNREKARGVNAEAAFGRLRDKYEQKAAERAKADWEGPRRESDIPAEPAPKSPESPPASAEPRPTETPQAAEIVQPASKAGESRRERMARIKSAGENPLFSLARESGLGELSENPPDSLEFHEPGAYYAKAGNQTIMLRYTPESNRLNLDFMENTGTGGTTEAPMSGKGRERAVKQGAIDVVRAVKGVAKAARDRGMLIDYTATMDRAEAYARQLPNLGYKIATRPDGKPAVIDLFIDNEGKKPGQSVVWEPMSAEEFSAHKAARGERLSAREAKPHETQAEPPKAVEKPPVAAQSPTTRQRVVEPTPTPDATRSAEHVTSKPAESVAAYRQRGLDSPLSPELRPEAVHKFLADLSAGKTDAEVKAIAKEATGKAGRNRVDALRSIHDDIIGSRKQLAAQPDLLTREQTAEFETHGFPNFRPELVGEGKPEAVIPPALESLIDAGKLPKLESTILKKRFAGLSMEEVAADVDVKKALARTGAKANKQNVENAQKRALKTLGWPEDLEAIQERMRASEGLERQEAAREKVGGGKLETGNVLFAGAPVRLLFLEKLFGKGNGADLNAFVKKWATAEGGLPREVFDEATKKDSQIQAYAQDVLNSEKDLMLALGIRDWAALDPKQQQFIASALRGNIGAMKMLPPEIADIVQSMRGDIDILSQRLIDAGAVSGKMEVAFQENKGTYLNRAYQVFTDPEWADKVPVEVRNRFKAWMHDEALKDGRDLSPEQLEGITRSLLEDGTAADNPIAFISKRKLGSKDLSILKRRKDVPPELRALWGEVEHPMAAYAMSIGKAANLLQNHIFLTRAREIGLQDGFFTTEPIGENTVKVAVEGSSVMSPLNGLYTTKEIKAAFEDIYSKKNLPGYLRAYMKGIALTKYAKTVGSPVTHLGNMLGNTGFMLANGHFRVGNGPKALKSLTDDTPAGRAYYRKLIELGLAGDSVLGREFQKTAEDALGAKDPFTQAGVITEKGIARAVKGGMDAVAKLYHNEDLVAKVYAFENEKSRYREAYPEWNDAELENHAAKIVRATYPTYSEVPKFVQALRRVPGLAPFVSFPSEVVRTTYNTARLAFSEMADPRTRTIGATRFAGTLASLSAFAAMAMAMRGMLGISRDEDDAVRKFLPDWSKDSQLLHLGKNADGTYKMIDIGRIDPHGYLLEPIMAASQARNVKEGAAEAIDSLIKPFVSEDVLTRSALDVARNKKEQGGAEVYNPQDTPLGRAKSVMGHLGKAFAPGSVDQLLQGKVPYSREVEPKKALGFKAKAFEEEQKNTEKLFASVARGKTVSDEELKTALQKSEEQRRKVFDEMIDTVHAAEMLGLSRAEVIRVLKDSGVSMDDARALVTGKYMPDVKRPESMKGLPLSEAQRRIRAGQVK